MDIKETIIGIRKNRCLSQRQFAKILGKSNTLVHTNERKPTMSYVVSLLALGDLTSQEKKSIDEAIGALKTGRVRVKIDPEGVQARQREFYSNRASKANIALLNLQLDRIAKMTLEIHQKVVNE